MSNVDRTVLELNKSELRRFVSELDALLGRYPRVSFSLEEGVRTLSCGRGDDYVFVDGEIPYLHWPNRDPSIINLYRSEKL